jgi:hypothetical protein
VFGDTSRAILVSRGVEPERIAVAGSIRFNWASGRETALGTDLLVATSNGPAIGARSNGILYRMLTEEATSRPSSAVRALHARRHRADFEGRPFAAKRRTDCHPALRMTRDMRYFAIATAKIKEGGP